MPKIRFIAGAKCVQCGEVDTTKMTLYDALDKADTIVCVACGYTDTRPKQVAQTPQQSESEHLDTVQVVKFTTIR